MMGLQGVIRQLRERRLHNYSSKFLDSCSWRVSVGIVRSCVYMGTAWKDKVVVWSLSCCTTYHSFMFPLLYHVVHITATLASLLFC
jgi:hypothetical protein